MIASLHTLGRVRAASDFFEEGVNAHDGARTEAARRLSEWARGPSGGQAQFRGAECPKVKVSGG